MGHGYWGGPWGGFGWVVPLLGFALMVVMVVACMRRMHGIPHCGCTPSHAQPASSEVETLRREIQELRDELRTMQGGSYR